MQLVLPWQGHRCAVPQRRASDKTCWCRRTRAEFQTWAEELASTHSYAVRFDGIGHALEEQKALQDPGWPAGITDIGTATQVFPCLLLRFLLLYSTSLRL